MINCLLMRVATACLLMRVATTWLLLKIVYSVVIKFCCIIRIDRKQIMLLMFLVRKFIKISGNRRLDISTFQLSVKPNWALELKTLQSLYILIRFSFPFRVSKLHKSIVWTLSNIFSSFFLFISFVEWWNTLKKKSISYVHRPINKYGWHDQFP